MLSLILILTGLFKIATLFGIKKVTMKKACMGNRSLIVPAHQEIIFFLTIMLKKTLKQKGQL
jgi:hypothetical protein